MGKRISNGLVECFQYFCEASITTKAKQVGVKLSPFEICKRTRGPISVHLYQAHEYRDTLLENSPKKMIDYYQPFRCSFVHLSNPIKVGNFPGPTFSDKSLDECSCIRACLEICK